MNKRKGFFLSLSFLDIVFRVAMWAIIIYFVVKGATRCYDLGYRVFTEEPIALEGYGRDVMCVPSTDYGNSGCNSHIRDGATLVENAKQVIEMME